MPARNAAKREQQQRFLLHSITELSLACADYARPDYDTRIEARRRIDDLISIHKRKRYLQPWAKLDIEEVNKVLALDWSGEANTIKVLDFLAKAVNGFVEEHKRSIREKHGDLEGSVKMKTKGEKEQMESTLEHDSDMKMVDESNCY
jgi:hypothetical protein